MVKKHLILIGIILGTALLLISTMFYPGGSQADLNSPGYDWKNNYLCNLFDIKAMNGAYNQARTWAVAGMFFLCLSVALFFIDFSEKIPVKSASRIIRFSGTGAMIFAFLTVTSYHDLMVTLANTLALVSLFYITFFIFKTKMNLLKLLTVFCLLIAYACTYIYYTRHYLELLPFLQKVDLLFILTWLLCLNYFTEPADFLIKLR
jgi:hypothetical protein